MSIYRGAYYSAWSCTGSARPGAKALMSWYLGAYGDRGAANLGIYVCKRLGSGYSIHGHGRACDMGTKPYNNPGGSWPDWGWKLADALRRNSAELGIQLIIFNRKVWSCRYPDKGWRYYGGSDPHDGHMHVELIPATAESLTVDRIERILGGSNASPSVPTTGAPAPTLREGDEGPAVGRLQGSLNDALGLGLVVDEDYGPATTAGVKALQRAAGIEDDGIYGDDSADALRSLLEDDMSWDEYIDMITGQGVSYSGDRWKARFVLASGHFYTLKYGQELLAEAKASRLREEAILAAVKGIDSKAIMTRIDQRATEDAARDAAAAQRDAEIMALVQQVGSGQLAADEVVARIGALLTGAGE